VSSLNAHDIAVYSRELYACAKYGVFDQILMINKSCVAVKRFSDCILILPRGSNTLLDWWRDLAAEVPFITKTIGIVPYGFYVSVPALMKVLDPLSMPLPIVLGGHSRGAAEAAQLAGEIVAAGGKVDKLLLLACPFPGDEKLSGLLSGIHTEAYRNLSDPVPLSPLLFGMVPVVEPYISLSVAPRPGMEFYGTELADHHIQCYVEGTQQIFGGDDVIQRQ
jgi:hypothetical protein